MPDPYFILLQIDYFIHQPVHVRQIKVLEKYLGVDNVVKIDLSADRFHDLHRPYATEGDMKIIESDQQAQSLVVASGHMDAGLFCEYIEAEP